MNQIQIPESAPFSEGQRAWLQTFLSRSVQDQSQPVEAVLDRDEEESSYSKKRPFPSTVIHNENLNAPLSEKETRHLAFSLEGSGLDYEVGDALGVYPTNSPEQVDAIITTLSLDPEEHVPLPDGGTAPLREALIGSYDIRNLTAPLLAGWLENAGSPALRDLLESEDKSALNDYCWGRELIDLVHDHPPFFSCGKEFVAVLKKLQPRLYSIASSPKAHPGEVHLTVGVVRYHSHGRDRGGVCSTFLGDRAVEARPKIFVHGNKAFRPPADDSRAMIMVGPGTGIAPFRAFLEERQATGAVGKNWLLFGNPHEETDFLYKDELGAMIESGVLTRLDTAFSRDQEQKVYVQDRMIEHGAELWKWLEEGAAFYVCGDASRMAKDVEAALLKVVVTHGGLPEEEATAYLKMLRKEKRYCRDVY